MNVLWAQFKLQATVFLHFQFANKVEIANGISAGVESDNVFVNPISIVSQFWCNELGCFEATGTI